MNNKEIWLAHLQTTNFDFYLVADSEEILWIELEQAWLDHAKKTGAICTWEEIKDSIWFNKQPMNLVWKRG